MLPLDPSSLVGSQHAIVIAKQYNQTVDPFREDFEERFHDILVDTRRTLDTIVANVKTALDDRNIKNRIPPLKQRDEQRLLAPLSFKSAAHHCGLGWIGKSGLLITGSFGPRVHLAAILVDGDFGRPEQDPLDDRCGSCKACVEACPINAIRDRNWEFGLQRGDLLDYQACNRFRSSFIPELGRKHSCGYCLLACPWGANTEPPCEERLING